MTQAQPASAARVQKEFDNLDALIRISRKDEQLRDPHILHDLCLRQELDLLIELLEAGGAEKRQQQINGRNQNGLVPLHVAVVSAEPPYLEDLINYLLYYGADRDAKCTPDGNTSLHLAIIYSKLVNAEISVPLLLREGAVPNLKNYADRTPKDYAYAMGYEDLAALLDEIERHPERRSEIDIYNWKEKFGAGRKPDDQLLRAAIQRGEAQTVGELVGKVNAAGDNKADQMLCYHLAVESAQRNKASVIDALASAGVDSRLVDNQGNSPIQLAIASLPHDKQMLDVIKALLRAGVPKGTKNKENKDALAMAQERGYRDVEELLTDSQPPKVAPPPRKEPPPASGRRPVHDILNDRGLIIKKKLEELRQLWASNPRTNPNVRSTDGADDTPLHVVVRRDQEDLVDFLLSKRAAVNVKNKRGETPLWLAQQTEFGYSLGIYDKLREANRKQVAQRRWNQLASRIDAADGEGQQQQQQQQAGEAAA